MEQCIVTNDVACNKVVATGGCWQSEKWGRFEENLRATLLKDRLREQLGP